MIAGLFGRFISFGVITAGVSFALSIYLAILLGSKYAELIVIVAIINLGANLASYGLPAKLVNTVYQISDGAFKITVYNFLRLPGKYLATLLLITLATYLMLDSITKGVLLSLVCCLGGVLINLANYYRAKKMINHFGFIMLFHSIFFPTMIAFGMDNIEAILALFACQLILIICILRHEMLSVEKIHKSVTYEKIDLSIITFNTVLLSLQTSIDKMYCAKLFDNIIASDYARASLTLTSFFLMANIFAKFYTTILPKLIEENRLNRFWKLMNLGVVFILPIVTLCFIYINQVYFINPIPNIVYILFCFCGALLINVKFFFGILFFQDRAKIILRSTFLFFTAFAVMSIGITSVWHISLVVAFSFVFQLLYLAYSYESPTNNLILS